MQILIVDKKYDNKKICNYILDQFPNLKSGTLYKALRKKDIRVNNVKINENIDIHENDEIKIFIKDELLYSSNFVLDIIYEDNNVLIVNKPIDIEVEGENSLTSMCKKYLNGYVEPCHRLDRNTTGLVIFAKNEESLNILLEKFKNHEIEKRYLATVYGIPKKNHDRLEAFLFKDAKNSMVYISDEYKKGYQKIITSYKIVSTNEYNNTSILDVNIETGKTHQIRAHLAYIGFPIIGDGKYGKNSINKKFHQRTQMLCAYYIRFNFKTNSGILNYLKDSEIKI